MLAAIADGESMVEGYSTGADCSSTLSCLERLGVTVARSEGPDGRTLRITGRGIRGLHPPVGSLDAGNSGSTMRMLAGILAAHPFSTTLTGDTSLCRRPMRRVITPLERMGAMLDSTDGRPPLTVHGTTALAAINFQPSVASAQVKTAVLLAGLHAVGTTTVQEPVPTRDHTERALTTFGAAVTRSGDAISIAGGQRLSGCAVRVPGDLSSAAFWMVAGAALPGSDVTIEGVGLNPSRTGIVDILRRMGASVDVVIESANNGEPIGTIRVRHGTPTPARIAPDEVPGVIDELPVLGVLATFGGELQVSGAQELRVKESDRISAFADGLRAMGGQIDEAHDGFLVRGTRSLTGGHVDARRDHRLAMAFAIAALGASGPTTITGAGVAAVSYPEFFTVLDALRA
jgi:3-phosphoshikimate 1-carboxyvinyltransferase